MVLMRSGIDMGTSLMSSNKCSYDLSLVIVSLLLWIWENRVAVFLFPSYCMMFFDKWPEICMVFRTILYYLKCMWKSHKIRKMSWTFLRPAKNTESMYMLVDIFFESEILKQRRKEIVSSSLDLTVPIMNTA